MTRPEVLIHSEIVALADLLRRDAPVESVRPIVDRLDAAHREFPDRSMITALALLAGAVAEFERTHTTEDWRHVECCDFLLTLAGENYAAEHADR